MLDGDMRYYANNLRNIYRSADYGDQFVKPERCRACSFDPYCMGVRRIYVETYGDAEVRPFQVDLAPLLPDFVRPLPPGASSEKSAVFAERHRVAPANDGLVQLRVRREGATPTRLGPVGDELVEPAGHPVGQHAGLADEQRHLLLVAARPLLRDEGVEGLARRGDVLGEAMMLWPLRSWLGRMR